MPTVTRDTAAHTDGVSYTGQSGGTQGGDPSQDLGYLGDTNDHSYIDVRFQAGAGQALDPNSIGGDELAIGGFGGSGVTVWNGSTPAVQVSSNTWRFLLSGDDFRPGTVVLTFDHSKFYDSRGPPSPAYETTQSFTVVGATADLTRTVTDANGDPTTVTLGGASVGLDALNGTGYLEVTFRPTSGAAIDPTSIAGGELTLTGPGGAVVPSQRPSASATSSTWRYGFTAPLAAGAYTATFAAGSFADTAGQVNLAETEVFHVEQPSAHLADPAAGDGVGMQDINGRGWVDVTFDAIDGQDVNPASIADTASEITITSSSSDTITVDGRGVARRRRHLEVPLLLHRLQVRHADRRDRRRLVGQRRGRDREHGGRQHHVAGHRHGRHAGDQWHVGRGCLHAGDRRQGRRRHRRQQHAHAERRRARPV